MIVTNESTKIIQTCVLVCIIIRNDLIPYLAFSISFNSYPLSRGWEVGLRSSRPLNKLIEKDAIDNDGEIKKWIKKIKMKTEIKINWKQIEYK